MLVFIYQDRGDAQSGGGRGSVLGYLHRELPGLRGESTERSSEASVAATGARCPLPE